MKKVLGESHCIQVLNFNRHFDHKFEGEFLSFFYGNHTVMRFRKQDNKRIKIGTDPGLGVQYMVMIDTISNERYVFTLVPSRLF